jgi:hypothetical protein
MASDGITRDGVLSATEYQSFFGETEFQEAEVQCWFSI